MVHGSHLIVNSKNNNKKHIKSIVKTLNSYNNPTTFIGCDCKEVLKVVPVPIPDPKNGQCVDQEADRCKNAISWGCSLTVS